MNEKIISPPFFARLSTFVSFILILCYLSSALSSFFVNGLNVDISYLDDLFLLFNLLILVAFFPVSHCSRVCIYILIFIAVSTLSFALNDAPLLNAALQMRSYILPFSAYLVCYYFLLNPAAINFLFSSILVFTVFLSLIGFFEFIFSIHFFNKYNKFGEIYSGVFRVHSLVGHPADFGYYLCFSIAMISCSFMSYPFGLRFSKRIHWSLIAGLIFCLSLTISKGPVLALIVSAGAFSFLAIKKGRVRFFTSLTLFFVLSVLIAPESWFGRLQGFVDGELNKDLTIQDEATRIGFYFQAASVIMDNPVVGVGPGMFGGWVASSAGSPVHDQYDIDTYGISSIDVFYPHLAGELGFLGFFSYILIFASLVILFRRRLLVAGSINDYSSVFYARLGIWISLLVLIAGVYSMINETFPHMIIYWIMIGCVDRATSHLHKGKVVF